MGQILLQSSLRGENQFVDVMPDPKHTILIVDDEAAVRRLLRRCFESENYLVEEANSHQETLDALKNKQVDLITLDVNLAGEDGLSLAREIRTFSSVPIIMVSGKGELIDTVLGLEVGADDYIAKPFQLREVLARVKSALRRSALNSTPAVHENSPTVADVLHEYRFADCVLCSKQRDIRKSDGTIGELTTAEFDLLQAFAKHSQQVLTRDQIMDQMKGTDWNPNDRTIDNQVARLRKKMSSMGMVNPIKTVRGLGYQFTMDVEKH